VDVLWVSDAWDSLSRCEDMEEKLRFCALKVGENLRRALLFIDHRRGRRGTHTKAVRVWVGFPVTAVLGTGPKAEQVGQLGSAMPCVEGEEADSGWRGEG
jgi:hypothetical protein